MSDCPHCATHAEVLQALHASETRLTAQVAGLNRALGAAQQRETALKAKLERQNETAKEAEVIYACLDVWEQHCWAGKGKPKMDINGERAGRVRKALAWGFEQSDICDAFRGLGLLPYRDKYNERSKTPTPGFKRSADVVEALRDETRLERFRDYYRRVLASPMERRREMWHQALAAADEAYAALVSDCVWERYRAGASKFWEQPQEWEVDAVERAFSKALALFGDTVGDMDLRLVSQLAVKSLNDARFKDECARRQVAEPQEIPSGERPALFVIEGKAA